MHMWYCNIYLNGKLEQVSEKENFFYFEAIYR
jgi:hypothetical protein